MSADDHSDLHIRPGRIRDRGGRTAPRVRSWLLLASGVVRSSSCNQAGNERTEQGFTASARVVHELEEAEVERQLVL